VIHLDLSFI